MVGRQGDGQQPELGLVVSGFYMDVPRLVALVAVEEEPEAANPHHRRHSADFGSARLDSCAQPNAQLTRAAPTTRFASHQAPGGAASGAAGVRPASAFSRSESELSCDTPDPLHQVRHLAVRQMVVPGAGIAFEEVRPVLRHWPDLPLDLRLEIREVVLAHGGVLTFCGEPRHDAAIADLLLPPLGG